MASSSPGPVPSQGYTCEFIDQVPEDYHCKKCTLVARALTITSCCVETYCQACVSGYLEQGLPCPACGQAQFTVIQQLKYRNRLKGLRVFCSLKDRGCEWSGTLDHLDSHLDPELDHCQYVAVECPLKCSQMVYKNIVKDHVARECPRRPFVCKHCSYKASYQDVMEQHLPECKYVPVQCPNRCGVTFDREIMGDHMKICRLEVVECEFAGVGCGKFFERENETAHMQDSTLKHLSLTASLAVKTKENLTRKLGEHRLMHEKILTKIQTEKGNSRVKEAEYEMKINALTKELSVLRKNLQEELGKNASEKQNMVLKLNELKKVNADLRTLESKLRSENKTMEVKFTTELAMVTEALQEERSRNVIENQKLTLEVEKVREELRISQQRLRDMVEAEGGRNKRKWQALTNTSSLTQTVVMADFRGERAKDLPGDWKTPPKYTHLGGYKYCVGVDANGRDDCRGSAVSVVLYLLPGEFDDDLKWPAVAKFSVKLSFSPDEFPYTTPALTWDKPGAFEDSFVSKRLKATSAAYVKHQSLSHVIMANKLYISCVPIVEEQNF